MPVIDEDNDYIVPVALSDTKESFPGLPGDINKRAIPDTANPSPLNIYSDDYKKIMDVAFYDPATADVDESEMLDEIPRENK